MEELREALDGVGEREVVWAQEEPENMGAGRFVVWNLRERLAPAARISRGRRAPAPRPGA